MLLLREVLGIMLPSIVCLSCVRCLDLEFQGKLGELLCVSVKAVGLVLM